MKHFWLTAILLFILALAAEANDFDHSHKAWNDLLQEHVSWISNGTASQVDYDGFQSDHEKLQSYLVTLSAIPQKQFDDWSRDEQLAFLINAYNAFTIKLILDNYPGISSIRETGSLFSSPWKKEFFRLLDDNRHLDWIEHEMIRGSGRYNEPLIHFAVNCASIGCPALLDEAFIADRLDEQLLDVTRRFLMDRSRNYFDSGNNRLNVSSIFNWYEEDFQKGWRGYNSRKDFFSNHAEWLSKDVPNQQRLQAGEYEFKFLEYDWNLNKM